MVEILAGEVAFGDCVGALSYEIDGFGDAPGEEDGDHAADDRAKNGSEPQSVERGGVCALELDDFGVSLGHLGLSEVSGHREEGLLQRKYLVLEGVVGLCSSLRGLGLVELLDLLFEGLQIGEPGVKLADACRIVAEVELRGVLLELGHSIVCLGEVSLARLAEVGGRRGVDAEEHVGLERVDAVDELNTQVAGGGVDRDVLRSGAGCEVVRLLDAHGGCESTEQHCADENARSEAEFRFEFHDDPYLREVVGDVITGW